MGESDAAALAAPVIARNADAAITSRDLRAYCVFIISFTFNGIVLLTRSFQDFIGRRETKHQRVG